MFEVFLLVLAKAWRDAKAYANAEREIWLHQNSGETRLFTPQMQANATLAKWAVDAAQSHSLYGFWAHLFRWVIRNSRAINPVFRLTRWNELQVRRANADLMQKSGSRLDH
jgi:hypothetical protein